MEEEAGYADQPSHVVVGHVTPSPAGQTANREPRRSVAASVQDPHAAGPLAARGTNMAGAYSDRWDPEISREANGSGLHHANRAEELSSVSKDFVPHRGVPVAAALVLASMVGIVMRIQLQALHDFPEAIVPPLYYPEAVGSVQIGFSTAMKPRLVRRYLPLFIGLTVGVAGSVTTFSSWSLLVFRSYAVTTLSPGRIVRILYRPPFRPVPENFSGKSLLTAYSGRTASPKFQTTVAQVILGFSISVSGMVFGRHLAMGIQHLQGRGRRNEEKGTDFQSNPLSAVEATAVSVKNAALQEATGLEASSSSNKLLGRTESQCLSGQSPTLVPHKETPHTIGPETWELSEMDRVDWTVTVLGAAAWALAVYGASSIDAATPNFATQWIWSWCFGPAGTLLRWRLSRLNLNRPNFPLGTFVANMIGSAALAGLYVASRWQGAGDASFKRVACLTIAGLMDGVCGCLTTVSTFVIELCSM
ncbi:MAG: CrcB-like protein-domain-containing protein, partial [Olpidium bornovanus]